MTSMLTRPTLPLWKLALAGLIAGFLATLIFHQSLWYVLNQVGLIPWARPAWPLDPIPPLGVPSVISKAFWGGLWGAALAPVFGALRGPAYWTAWMVAGALALTLVAFFVVPPIKGQPIPDLWPRFLAALLVNGAWGFGTALFLRWFAVARP
ncbi:MAG: hypothetical protein WBF40_11570 [Methyloceanibacter sp.]